MWERLQIQEKEERMFKEKDVEEMLRKLAACLSGPDGRGIDVEEFIQEADTGAVAQYIRNHLEPVYTYRAKGSHGKRFDYFGRELLPQRGLLVLREMERLSSGLVEAGYERELWILEDMTLAVVTCFSVGVESRGEEYCTEFRTYKGTLDREGGFTACREDLEELFQEMCVEQYELGAPYFEL